MSDHKKIFLYKPMENPKPDLIFGDFALDHLSGLWVKPQPSYESGWLSMMPQIPYIFRWTWDESPPKPVPEEVPFEMNMMEALIGWKAWSVENGKLYSAQQAEIAWPADAPLVAKCENGCTEPPCEHHTCGIYAGGNREEAQNYADEKNELIGLVYGWGRYVRGGDGWRAQFAYPKCFYLKQHQAELIEPLKAYHVPIYVEQPVLMYNPEEDGYEYRGEEADWNLRTIEESAAIERKRLQRRRRLKSCCPQL